MRIKYKLKINKEKFLIVPQTIWQHKYVWIKIAQAMLLYVIKNNVNANKNIKNV